MRFQNSRNVTAVIDTGKYTSWSIKTFHFIFYHNSHISWRICTLLVPLKTGKNTRDAWYTDIRKNTAVLKVTVLCFLNIVRSILRESLHVDEISSRSSAYIKMAEEIVFQNGRISNFEGLMNLMLTLDRVILHTVDLYNEIPMRSLPMGAPNAGEVNKIVFSTRGEVCGSDALPTKTCVHPPRWSISTTVRWRRNMRCQNVLITLTAH